MDMQKGKKTAKYPVHRTRNDPAFLTSILQNKVVLIGDTTPVWNNGVENYNRLSVSLSEDKIYGKNGVNFEYLALAFGQWDARLANWFMSLKETGEGFSYSRLAAYFRLAAQKHGKCSILLLDTDETLKRHKTEELLAYIESTKEYCWYILFGGEALDSMVIPEHMYARRMDISEYNLTKREMQIYFSATGIQLSTEQGERLYQLIGSWTFAAHLFNKHFKRNEAVRDIDFDIAVNEVFCELDSMVLDDMDQQEIYTAVLLSEFESFPYELAVFCCPYKEGVIKKCLYKVPAVRLTKDGTELAMHPLLRAYWQSKRHDIPKKLRSSCKNRAAKWYSMKQDLMPALKCAIDAGDSTLTRETLRKLCVYSHYHDAGSIAEMLEQIGSKALKEQPMLWAYKVILHYAARDTATGEREMKALEQYLRSHFDTADARQAKGEIMLLKGFINQPNPSSIDYFAKAVECFDECSEVCNAYLVDAVSNSTAIPYRGGKYSLLDTCGIIQKAAPFLYKATNNWGRGNEHLCMVEYGYLTGQAGLVIDSASKTITDAMAYQQWDVACMAHFLLMLQYIEMGMVKEVIDAWRTVHSLAFLKKSDNNVIEDIADICVYFNTRQPYLLPLWVRNSTAFETRKKCYQPGREYYLRALYLWQKGEPHNAFRLVSEAMGSTRFTNEWIIRLHLLALKTILYAQLEGPQKAEALLNECYEMAAPEQLVMPFMEFGNSMVVLLDYYIQLKKAKPEKPLPPLEWMENMKQKAIKMEEGGKTFFTGYYKWLQASYGTNLTGNEYRLLQMLCLDYSSEAIRDELGLSKNHIHAVMRRVCKKLGTNTIEEAITYGRSINMQGRPV